MLLCLGQVMLWSDSHFKKLLFRGHIDYHTTNIKLPVFPVFFSFLLSLLTLCLMPRLHLETVYNFNATPVEFTAKAEVFWLVLLISQQLVQCELFCLFCFFRCMNMQMAPKASSWETLVWQLWWMDPSTLSVGPQHM